MDMAAGVRTGTCWKTTKALTMRMTMDQTIAPKSEMRSVGCTGTAQLIVIELLGCMGVPGIAVPGMPVPGLGVPGMGVPGMAEPGPVPRW